MTLDLTPDELLSTTRAVRRRLDVGDLQLMPAISWVNLRSGACHGWPAITCTRADRRPRDLGRAWYGVVDILPARYRVWPADGQRWAASARAAAQLPYTPITVDGAGQSRVCTRSKAAPPRRRAWVPDQSVDDGKRP